MYVWTQKSGGEGLDRVNEYESWEEEIPELLRVVVHTYNPSIQGGEAEGLP